jgi:hypothetical protein
VETPAGRLLAQKQEHPQNNIDMVIHSDLWQYNKQTCGYIPKPSQYIPKPAQTRNILPQKTRSLNAHSTPKERKLVGSAVSTGTR